jgi:hypothetical protein
MKTDETPMPAAGPLGGTGEPERWYRPGALPFRRAFPPGDLRAAALVVVVAAVLGAPVGAIWAVTGPHASVAVTGEGAVIADHRQEAFIAADGTFAAIAIVTGLVLGIAAYLWRRRRGPWMTIGVALGGLAGAYVAWKVGHRVGLPAYERHLAGEPGGAAFDRPVDLRARGALFLQPVVAVIVYVLAAGWSRFADLGRAAPEPAVPAAAPSGPGWPDPLLPGVARSVSSGPSGPGAPPAAPVPPPVGGASSPPA